MKIAFLSRVCGGGRLGHGVLVCAGFGFVSVGCTLDLLPLFLSYLWVGGVSCESFSFCLAAVCRTAPPSCTKVFEALHSVVVKTFSEVCAGLACCWRALQCTLYMLCLCLLCCSKKIDRGVIVLVCLLSKYYCVARSAAAICNLQGFCSISAVI